jgi:hypothetical protein
MYNHLGFYLATKVAQPLAAEFGDRLERMSKPEKLLLINILSGVLHELEATLMESYSAAEYIHEQGIHPDVVGNLTPLLERFDEYDSSTNQTILMVLVLSMQGGGADNR